MSVSQPSIKWPFAEPDFSKFNEWDKVAPKELQPGDLVACLSPTTRTRNEPGIISKVLTNTSLGNGEGVITFTTVWGGTVGGKSRSCLWASVKNKVQYRLFQPEAKPVPPIEEAEEQTALALEETAPTLTAIAGVDAGLATLIGLVRDQNKILCSMLAGISATQDEVRELREEFQQTWGTASTTEASK